MKGARILGWTLFTLWALVLFGVQARLAADGNARWTPELGLVLAILVLARGEARDLVMLVLLSTLARAATSGDPPLVILTGFLGVLLVSLSLRGVVELSGALGRTIACSATAAAFVAWLALAHAVRSDHATAPLLATLGLALSVGISSGLTALAAGPLIARLPGLTPLRSRTW